jgi:hypothetical protein
LREVAAESESYGDFGYNLKDFLHEFARAGARNLPLERMLAEEPPRLAGRFPEGKVCDAFLAATADYFSRENRLPTPAWALKEDLMLDEPWFSVDFPQVRMRLLRDTPSAFKDKNLFIFESALTVA